MDSKAKCDQLNLAHVTRNKKAIKEENQTNKRQCPFDTVQVKIREGSQSGRNKSDYGGKDL